LSRYLGPDLGRDEGTGTIIGFSFAVFLSSEMSSSGVLLNGIAVVLRTMPTH
jgi:hypothetical protein